MREVQQQVYEELQRLLGADPRQSRFLLAVSGGLDSMVLLDVFHRLNIPSAVGHINFRLRGEAADGDATFVEKIARRKGLPFYSTAFDTLEGARLAGESVQLHARRLRYHWLEELRQTEGFDYIVTAHHLNDALETFLYNFAKGSGLRGLTGIPARRASIIRPLLAFSRAELEDYYHYYELAHREDSSNASAKYKRNLLRHHVIPVLKQINPGLEKTAGQNFRWLQESRALMEEAVAQWQQQFVKEENGLLRIDKKALIEHPSATTLLFYTLKPFGFNSAQAQQLVHSLGVEKDTASGAVFYSPTHILVVDRETLQVGKRISDANETFFLEEKTKELLLPEGDILQIKQTKNAPQTLEKAVNIAYLDKEKLQFPLKLRRWQAGDWFCPLGMKGGRKKLKKLFTDMKLSRLEKAQLWILENGNGDICWVVGVRPDERYKIEESTEFIYTISFKKHNPEP